MPITFKDHTGAVIVFDDLPEQSRQAMVNRAVSHIFGNETASNVVAKIRAEIAAAASPARKIDSVTGDEVKAYRANEANGEKIAVMIRESQDAKLTALRDGTLGIRASGGGSAIDPLEKEVLRLAKEEILEVFRKQGWKFPKGEATFSAGPVTLDASGWVERWANESTDSLLGGKGEPNRARLESAAKRNVAARAKRAGSVVAVGESADFASLGL